MILDFAVLSNKRIGLCGSTPLLFFDGQRIDPAQPILNTPQSFCLRRDTAQPVLYSQTAVQPLWIGAKSDNIDRKLSMLSSALQAQQLSIDR